MRLFYKALYNQARGWLENANVGLTVKRDDWIRRDKEIVAPPNKYNIQFKIDRPPFEIVGWQYIPFICKRVCNFNYKISQDNFINLSEEDFIEGITRWAGEEIERAWDLKKIGFEEGIEAKSKRHFLGYTIPFSWFIFLDMDGSCGIKIHTSVPSDPIRYLLFPIFPTNQAIFFKYNVKYYLKTFYNPR